MSTNKKLFQVDAFTDTPFHGNPAGVMLLDTAIENEIMQAIAAEMNVSETAFVVVGKKPFDIRYFTPQQEVPLCGHATLSAAHMKQNSFRTTRRFPSRPHRGSLRPGTITATSIWTFPSTT